MSHTEHSSDDQLNAGFERHDRCPDRAEFAMVIADDCQGCGLGRILLGQLAEPADGARVGTLTREMLATNHRMLCHSGLGVSFRSTGGVVVVGLPTSLDRGADTARAA
jgi:hypothetical protein